MDKDKILVYLSDKKKSYGEMSKILVDSRNSEYNRGKHNFITTLIHLIISGEFDKE